MKNKNAISKLCATALLGALCYIGFMYLKITIPTPGGATAIHFGNTFCVLSALLLGGVPGGISGAVGMGLADLLDPVYISSAPKTILLKFCIGLIVGFVAHRYAHIKDHTDDTAYTIKWALIASIAGMAFNIVADPVVGFFYKNFILGVPYEAAKILTAWASVTTSINAITSVILATTFYTALRKQLKHLPFFKES